MFFSLLPANQITKEHTMFMFRHIHLQVKLTVRPWVKADEQRICELTQMLVAKSATWTSMFLGSILAIQS